MTTKRAMVISGGGAKGAWGVGIAKGLVQHLGNDYSTVIGTSTGSLMGPFILDNDFVTLEDQYTSIEQDQIFNENPFNNKGGINGWKAAWRIIRNKQSIGETEALKEKIKSFVSIDLYSRLHNSNKTFGAAVTNLNTGQSEVKTLKDSTYNEIVDWIWASANQPVFMSLLIRDNAPWVDGGLRDYAAIKYVLDHKLADEIDVLIHNTPNLIENKNLNDAKILDILLRTIGIFSSDVAQNDIANAQLLVRLDSEINLNFYFMDKSQTDRFPNNLFFEKDVMKEVLTEAFQSIVDGTRTLDQCKITMGGQIVSAHPQA